MKLNEVTGEQYRAIDWAGASQAGGFALLSRARELNEIHRGFPSCHNPSLCCLYWLYIILLVLSTKASILHGEFVVEDILWYCIHPPILKWVWACRNFSSSMEASLSYWMRRRGIRLNHKIFEYIQNQSAQGAWLISGLKWNMWRWPWTIWHQKQGAITDHQEFFKKHWGNRLCWPAPHERKQECVQIPSTAVHGNCSSLLAHWC